MLEAYVANYGEPEKSFPEKIREKERLVDVVSQETCEAAGLDFADAFADKKIEELTEEERKRRKIFLENLERFYPRRIMLDRKLNLKPKMTTEVTPQDKAYADLLTISYHEKNKKRLEELRKNEGFIFS